MCKNICHHILVIHLISKIENNHYSIHQYLEATQKFNVTYLLHTGKVSKILVALNDDPNICYGLMVKKEQENKLHTKSDVLLVNKICHILN